MTSATHEDLAAVVVDPRLRARRVAVRKEAGRRRLHRLVLLVVVAVLALTTVIVLKSPILDVDEVGVAGARITGADVIAEAAGVSLGSPLLLVDLEATQRRVEALPWVEEATVERSLPGSLIIDVVERSPAAMVRSTDAAVLVDPEGVVLSTAGAMPPAFVGQAPFVSVLVGEAPPGPGGRVDGSLADAIGIAARLRANPAGAVVAVRIDHGLRLELVGGATVELGDSDALDAKVQAFRTVYARVDRACLSRLDLRVPTHPVLTRDEPCS